MVHRETTGVGGGDHTVQEGVERTVESQKCCAQTPRRALSPGPPVGGVPL